MNGLKKTAILLSIALVIANIPYINCIQVLADETIDNDILTGSAGNPGTTWTYDKKTKTMTFSGEGIYDCDYELVNEVENVVFDDSVNTVSISLFSDEQVFSELKTVYLGKNVRNYSGHSFYLSDKIECYTVAEENKTYFSHDGDLYYKVNGEQSLYKAAVCNPGNTYYMWEGSTGIWSCAFYGNRTTETFMTNDTKKSIDISYLKGIKHVYLLNPECEFYGGTSNSSDVTIHGFPNSVAYKLCKSDKFPFDPINLETLLNGNLVEANNQYSVTAEEKQVVNYFFKPKDDGIYRIDTQGLADTELYIFDSDSFGVNDKDGGAGNNAQIEEKLSANVLYMIRVNHQEYKAFESTLNIERINEGLENIVLKAQANQEIIETYQNLDITITASGLGENEQLLYNLIPEKLEQAVDGKWVEIPLKISTKDIPTNQYGIPGNGKLSVPIYNYYGELKSGEYRYSHLIEGRLVHVDFSVINLNEMPDDMVIRENGEKQISITKSGKSFYIKAEMTGTYTFYTIGNEDTSAKLYKINEKGFMYSSDNPNDDINFKIKAKLRKNEIYILNVSVFSNSEKTVTLVTEGPCIHEYEVKEVVDATCDTMGYTCFRCTKCGYEKIDLPVAEMGHHYVDSVNMPTDTTWGYTTHVCEICKDEYYSDYVEPLMVQETQNDEDTTRQNGEETTQNDGKTANGQEQTTEIITTAKAIAPTKIKRVKRVQKTKVKLTFKKIAKAKKYKVEYSTDRKFRKKVKSIISHKNYATTKSLKKGTTYYFRVRVLNGTKKSKWSAVKKFKY